jgi:hypothetical protein
MGAAARWSRLGSALVPRRSPNRLSAIRPRDFACSSNLDAPAMKLIIGIIIAVLYAVLSGLAFTASKGGWSLGQPDLGFWWAVIGTLLGVAGLGALFGTWFHTRPSEE